MIKDLCYQAKRVCGQGYAYTSRQTCSPLLLPSPLARTTDLCKQSCLFIPLSDLDSYGCINKFCSASWGKILFRQSTRWRQRDPGRFSGNIYCIYILLLYILCSSELLQDFGLVDGQLSLFRLGVCMFIFLCVVFTFLQHIVMLLNLCVCSFAPWLFHIYIYTYYIYRVQHYGFSLN
jgi:hypothetical protein